MGLGDWKSDAIHGIIRKKDFPRDGGKEEYGMNTAFRRRALALLTAVLTLAALLCGCAGKGGNAPAVVTPKTDGSAASASPAPEKTPAPQSPQPAESEASPEPEPPELPEDVQALADAAQRFVTVRSTEELVAAVAPDTAILVEPGDYNLSGYLQSVWEEKDGGWDPVTLQQYVMIEPGFDGVTLIVKGADRLSIFGRGAAEETELVVEPRYADVLRFVDCADLSLARLTLGHTENGECAGNVLRFDDCRGVELSSMDLYGCGVYGLYSEGMRDMRVRGCSIHDCSYGPCTLEHFEGELLFEDCEIGGNGGGFSFFDCEDADIRFVRCTFGEYESGSLSFREDIAIEDCTFSEFTQYPDFDPEYESALEPTDVEPEIVENSVWLGVSMYNFETAEETGLPLRREGCTIDVVLRLNADGTGTLEGLEDEPLRLRWEPDPELAYGLLVTMQGEYVEAGRAELYTQIYALGKPMWLELWLGELSFRFIEMPIEWR